MNYMPPTMKELNYLIARRIAWNKRWLKNKKCGILHPWGWSQASQLLRYRCLVVPLYTPMPATSVPFPQSVKQTRDCTSHSPSGVYLCSQVSCWRVNACRGNEFTSRCNLKQWHFTTSNAFTARRLQNTFSFDSRNNRSLAWVVWKQRFDSSGMATFKDSCKFATSHLPSTAAPSSSASRCRKRIAHLKVCFAINGC